jgi:glycosidase
MIRRFGFGVASSLFALSAATSIGAAACGSSETNNRNYGVPPDAAIFNPGLGGNDGYGSGGGGYDGGTVCPDEFKACPHEFTYTPPASAGTVTSVEIRGDWGGPDTWQAGVKMTQSGAAWKGTVPVPLGKPVQYKYVLNGTTWVVDANAPTVTDQNNNTNNTFAGETCAAPICNEPGALPPGVYDWRDAVMYFVFVDRFFDGNPANNCNIPGVSGPIANYQGGDWAGVTAKINAGYFDDLGVNTLWITVPFKNPNVAGAGVGGDNHMYSAYHGYWPTEVGQPEECFGTLQDLKGMVTAAHAKGIKILFDYAMVHVHSSSSIYASNPGWFWPNDNGRGGDCICGGGCSWDNLPDRERCWFTSYLPHWNYTNQAARDFSVNTAIQWIKDTGVDGFRLDAIKHVDISWLTQLRTQINSQILATQTPKQRFYLVGETFDFFSQATLKSYVDPATKMDGQFDFPLRRVVVESVLMRTQPMSGLASFMDQNEYYYGANALMSPFLGNHDLPRIIHLAADNRLWGNDQGYGARNEAWGAPVTIPQERSAFERVANGFAVLFTNRGVPLVYYGDEIGMPGAGDPDNRRFMQWSNLDANQVWLHDRVKKLLAIRAAHPALRRGARTTLSVDADSWAYSRVTTGDTVYVAINRSDSPKSVGGLPAGPLTELVDGQNATGPTVTIPPRQTRIFVTK